jgi:hypothetical protein
MGEPMGRHSHTRYIIPNPKKGPKRVRDPAISALSCALPSTACRSPKIRSNMTKNPQNLVKGQHAPNTHLCLVSSHHDLTRSSSKDLSLARAASTCCCATTSFSVNSCMTASLTGPSRRCSTAVTTCSSSGPRASISVNSW